MAFVRIPKGGNCKTQKEEAPAMAGTPWSSKLSGRSQISATSWSAPIEPVRRYFNAWVQRL